MMNTTNLGRLGEAKVVARLTELGWYPFTDPSGKCPVDLVAWKDGRLVSLQVKACNSKPYGVSYSVQLRSTRPNRTGNAVKLFDPASVDYLAVYLQGDDLVCFVPSGKISSGRQVSMNLERAPRSLYAYDFLEL